MQSSSSNLKSPKVSDDKNDGRMSDTIMLEDNDQSNYTKLLEQPISSPLDDQHNSTSYFLVKSPSDDHSSNGSNAINAGSGLIPSISHDSQSTSSTFSHFPHSSHHDEHESFWYVEGLFHRPKLAVDWGKHNTKRKISWSELFFDLVFATSIAKLTEGLYSKVLSPYEFVILLILVFQQWQSWIFFCTRFYSDDLSGKIYTSIYMLGVFGLNIHIQRFNDSDGFLIFWLFLRIFTLLLYIRIFIYLPRARRVCMYQFSQHIIIIGFQIAALLSHSSRIYLFLAVAVLNCSYLFIFVCTTNLRDIIPIDVHHFIERTGCFVIIVMGEAINDLVGNDDVGLWNHIYEYFLIVLLGFIVVVSLKMLYFDIDVIPMKNHAIRRNRILGAAWIEIHSILICSVGVICAGIRMFITLVGRKPIIESTSSESETELNELFNKDEDLARSFILLGILSFLAVLLIFRLLHSRQSRDPAIICENENCRLMKTISNSTLLYRVWLFQMICQTAIVIHCLFLYFFVDSNGLSDLGLLLLLACLGLYLVGINFIDELLCRKISQKHFAESNQQKTIQV